MPAAILDVGTEYCRIRPDTAGELFSSSTTRCPKPRQRSCLRRHAASSSVTAGGDPSRCGRRRGAEPVLGAAVIGAWGLADVAAGQGAVPHRAEEPLRIQLTAIARHSPLSGCAKSLDSRRRSGYALLASQTQRRSLTLIAARYAASGHARRRRSCYARSLFARGQQLRLPARQRSQSGHNCIRIRWVTATPRSARCRVLRPEACST
jgi:hypothetical protein